VYVGVSVGTVAVRLGVSVGVRVGESVGVDVGTVLVGVKVFV